VWAPPNKPWTSLEKGSQGKKEAGGTFVLPSITTMGTSIVGHR